MLLPAQRGAAERDAMLLGRRLQRFELAAGAESGERRAVGLGGLARGIEGEMQDAARRLDRRERAGMYLAEHRRAQGVGRQPHAVLDGDFRGHSHPGRTNRPGLASRAVGWRKICLHRSVTILRA